ncbi:small-subunit processome [Ceratobasidium sp. AG-I]|nr:small-subunit processome [Ceratobasidium sp. AG-I]
MKRIKDAEHLAFPLQGPGAGKGAGTSNADIVGRFQPTTPLESAISSLLRAAHLHTDAATAEAENTLIPATISPDDLASRRAQLRATRELMFRADAKAKRVAKIKSKAFRRMKKREREKQGEAAMELGLDDVDEEEERMKAETLRAKERATLRHRTTGKWAQAMRRKGEMGDEEMEGVQSLVDRSEVLRRKIAGDSESSDDEDGHGEERDIRELEELGRVGGGVKGKGIMGMKFMRDAVARAEREAGGMADEVRLEMLGLERDDAEGMGDQVVGGNVGRRVYKPGQVKPLPEFSDVSSTLKSSESNDSPTDTLTPLPNVPRSNAPSQSPPSDTTHIPIPNPWIATATSSTDTNTPNPWLAVAPASTGKLSRKANVVQTTKMQKVQSKTEAERAKAREEALVEIDMAQAMVVSEKPKAKKGGEKETGAVKVDAAYAPSDDEGSETDEKGPMAFKQRELVAMAFAGDNVIEDFSAEKQRIIDEDAPKEVDTTLVGWGSWGGRGTKKAAPRPNLIKKIAGVDASKRVDAGKAHVIISEKKDKKASKYLVKDLPYPYTSREQFARSMATPIGTEWNTRVAHQRATLPRVVKKMGTVIDPLEKLF